MKRSSLSLLFVILCVPFCLTSLAQTDASLAASQTPSAIPPAPYAASTAPPMKSEKGPIGAISFGYFYLGAQGSTGSWAWHTQGFYGIPQVNVTPWLGFIGDFTSSYNTGANTHENIHAFLGGPIVTAYSKKKLSPFLFVTAGKVRDSKAGTITSSPALAGGGGLTYKLNKHVSLLFVPGEYVRAYPAMGADLNNVTARFGIVLPISR